MKTCIKSRIIILLLCAAISDVSQLPAAQPPQSMSVAQEITTRPLIIIFDPNNADGPGCSKRGALRSDFLAALQQNSAPVIASRWFWDYVILCDNNANLLTNWDAYISDPSIIHATGLTHEPILVFIPKQEEFLAGIKKNNLIKINPEIPLPIPDTAKTSSTDLKTYLKNILITKADLTAQQPVLWDIYLTGHGLSGKEIAGMTIDAFGSFLDFLNDAISTRTLLYLTCFSGGINLNTPYQYPSNGTFQDKDLNFTVISGNMVSSSTYIPDHYNFKEYFKGIDDYYRGKKEARLTDVIKNVLDWQATFQKNHILMLPSIRFPHTGWFTVTDLDKRLFRLNDVVIMKEKNAITIPPDVEIILLQTRYIPIPIIITSPTIPLFVPYISDQHYFFKEITASNASLLNVKSWTAFMKNIMGLGPIKPSEDFLTMYSKLKPLMNFDNFFFIEKLTTHLQDQQTKTGSLGWGDSPLVFNNVIVRSAITPHIPQIVLTYNGQPAYFMIEKGYISNFGYWTIGSSSFVPNFKKTKESIRKQSSLPETMTTDERTPLDPLLYGYLQRQHSGAELDTWKGTLSGDQQERLKQLMDIVPPPLE